MKKYTKLFEVNVFIKITLLFLVISIVFLSFGYASETISSKIENISLKVRPQGKVRITGFSINDSSNASSSNQSYNVNDVFASINLPNSDSSVTYKVDATVLLSSEMKLTSITGLNSNLEYTISNYNLGDALCNTNNECNYGATDELLITIKYKEGAYDSSNTNYALNLHFNFDEISFIAKIGNTRYNTLQDAINAVPTDNVQKTIILLKNTSEALTVSSNQNISFNLQNFTISNNGNAAVIENHGTIYISNGIITCSANHAAINNDSNGNVYMSGGKIIATGSRQAIYNNGGHVEISENAYLSSTSSIRATLDNKSGATMIITGGTITSSNYYGVQNAGALTIGVKDDMVDNSSILIKGNNNGVYASTNLNFYDGIIEGKTPINKESFIADIEDNYSLMYEQDGNNKKLFLAIPVTVTFNPAGGNVSVSTKIVEKNTKIGEMPTAVRTKYEFVGWFTESENGVEVTENTIIENDVTIFAHWRKVETYVAQLGDNQYESLQEAINDVSKNNTKTTITLLNNVSEVLTISNNQYIEFDMQGYQLNNSLNNPVIKNNGTLEITNGKIASNATQGAINNEKNGKLIMSGGRIEATGTRQAIYNNGGTVTISNNAYLISNSSERATVQNLASGTINILGGTIISDNFSAVYNAEGIVTIGLKGSNINTSSPVLRGKIYGINNEGTFNFYDGILMGISSATNGTINEIEDNSTIINGTQTISSQEYQTAHLE